MVFAFIRVVMDSSNGVIGSSFLRRKYLQREGEDIESGIAATLDK